MLLDKFLKHTQIYYIIATLLTFGIACSLYFTQPKKKRENQTHTDIIGCVITPAIVFSTLGVFLLKNRQKIFTIKTKLLNEKFGD